MLTKLLDECTVAIGPVVWSAPAPPVSVSVPAAVAAPSIDQQVRAAYEAGFREGESRARKEAEQKAQQLTGQLAASLSELAATRADVVSRAETEVVRLSVEIARRILHREVSLDSDALAGLVKAALQKLGAQEHYRARVHSAQAALVRRCLSDIRGGGELEVIADPSLPEGGIVFECAQGSLDASIETQLREIERGLADDLGGRA